jgi:hypothetical protein
MKDRNSVPSANDFYPLADALAMKFEVDMATWHIKGRGDVTVDIGQFKVRLVMETVSTVVDDDASRVGMIVNCGSGQLGLFVTFKPRGMKTTVSPIDLSKLPKDGAEFFEHRKLQNVDAAWEELLAEIGPVRSFEMDYKKDWTEECRAPSSAGPDPEAELPIT